MSAALRLVTEESRQMPSIAPSFDMGMLPVVNTSSSWPCAREFSDLITCLQQQKTSKQTGMSCLLVYGQLRKCLFEHGLEEF